MIGILSVFAQLERETILERTRIGIEKRAKDGKWRGGGKIPFPYRYDKESGSLIPIPEQVEILHKMISLYLSGKSFGKIGEIVGMDDRLVEKRLLSIKFLMVNMKQLYLMNCMRKFYELINLEVGINMRNIIY